MSFQSSFCNWAEYRVHLQLSVYFHVLLVVFASACFTCKLGTYEAFLQSAWVFRVSLLVFTVVCICDFNCICIRLQLEQVVLVWAVGVFSRAPECARRPGQRLCLLVGLNTFAPHFLVDYIWNKKMGGKGCIVHVCSTPPTQPCLQDGNFPFKISNCS